MMWEDKGFYWAWRGGPEGYHPPPYDKGPPRVKIVGPYPIDTIYIAASDTAAIERYRERGATVVERG